MAGYFLGSAGSSVGVVASAAMTATVALGIFALDGLFIYLVVLGGTSNLYWAIPVTLAFMVGDFFFFVLIVRVGAAIVSAFAALTKCSGDKMLKHYHALQTPR
jgi:hypothetical protein